MTETQYDVFLSYNGRDRAIAERLAHELDKVKLRVWLDCRELPAGGEFPEKLYQAVEESRATVLLVGTSGLGRWQESEVGMAVSRKRRTRSHRVVPVLLPGADPKKLSGDLDQVTYVDCRAGSTSGSNLDQLIDGMLGRIIVGITERQVNRSVSQIGETFQLKLKKPAPREKTVTVGTLPNSSRTSLLDITWATFGIGIEMLRDQIRNMGIRLTVDACFGINDAGLVMATFINSAALNRVKLGYVKCGGKGMEKQIVEGSIFPALPAESTIMLFDFEVKRSDVLGMILDRLRREYKRPKFYFSVFSAMTDKKSLRVSGFHDLVSAKNLAAAKLEDIFIAFTMHEPGIEPPLELR